MATRITEAQSYLAPDQYPYQYIGGLQKIYFEDSAVPRVFFVFNTENQAELYGKEVDSEVFKTHRLGNRLLRKQDDDLYIEFLEILKCDNLSPIQDEKRVLSYCAKQENTFGRPIESVQELLRRIVEVMKQACPSEPSYQYIDGLEKIYCGSHGSAPCVSFVFESVKRVRDCDIAVLTELVKKGTLTEKMEKSFDPSLVDFLEVDSCPHISPAQEHSRTLTYYAEQKDTVGRPIATVDELLKKLVKVMKRAASSSQKREVAIFKV